MSTPIRSSLANLNVKTPTHPAIQISTGEENQSIESLNRRLSSPQKRKPDTSLTGPDKRHRLSVEQSETDSSTCGTDISVSDRRLWLQAFGKHHERQHPLKTTTVDQANRVPTFKHQIKMGSPPKAPRGAFASTESAASSLMDRMMSSSRAKPEQPRSFPTHSFRPKITKDEVQATNEGYASVAKLSEWLANDPTSTKKIKHIRRGKNVISKSRNYEKELDNVIVIESNIPRGGVQDKKKIIQGAFGSPGAKYRRASNLRDLAPRYAVSEAGLSTISVSEKKDWLKKAFKNALEADEAEDKEPGRSEIIVNDAASSLSVSDKKDWLKNAFKNGKATPAVPSSGTPSKKHGYGKAMTDIMHTRDADDDAKARTKARFLARSGRTPVKTAEVPVTKPLSRPSQETESQGLRVEEHEERAGPPSSSETATRSVLSSEGSISFEEDQTPVDFRLARMALIHRSKQNGHEMQVVNKVYLKKNKFEKLIESEKRRSGIHDLHKPSWEEVDPTTGRPSNAYDKKMIPNIAPQRSFEELP
jgi:hypothetical protein